MAKITEPMTMFTDYLLAVFALIFSYLLLVDDFNSSQFFWALSLIATAFGAIGGGTSHGFKEFFSERTNALLWKISIIPIGIGAFFMTVATVYSSLLWEYRFGLIIILGITTVVYCYWIAFVNDGFIYVIVYYIPLMIFVLILQSVRYFTSGQGGYIIFGVLVSFLAAAIQIALKDKLPQSFNHNDLFHIVQLLGLYLFYLGAELSSVI